LIDAADPSSMSMFSDPEKELEMMNILIDGSKLPVPSNLRKRGFLLARLGRYRKAMQDFDKAIQFGQ
jgi:predicted RNA polymerase sigma factor